MGVVHPFCVFGREMRGAGCVLNLIRGLITLWMSIEVLFYTIEEFIRKWRYWGGQKQFGDVGFLDFEPIVDSPLLLD